MENVVAMLRQRLVGQEIVDVPDQRVPNPKISRSGGLGPEQLKWCRRRLEGFAVDEAQATAAREHTERSRNPA